MNKHEFLIKKLSMAMDERNVVLSYLYGARDSLITLSHASIPSRPFVQYK
jgi:hypothetical protein